MSPSAGAQPLKVVVVGGGVAGLEAVMALRALAGARVRIVLLTPQTEFVYRPLSVAEPFEAGEARRHALDSIARDFDVELVADELHRVAPGSRSIVTRSGAEMGYDELVIATGALPRPAWDHVLSFTGPRDTRAMQALVRDVERGTAQRIAFVVPTGITWPLPLYELALMTAARARAAGQAPSLVVFSPEEEPLAVFGSEASHDVAAQLDAAGMRFVRASGDIHVTPDGKVTVGARDDPAPFDRVVAVPRLEGIAPHGLPRDEDGFIPIDTHGAVEGLEHVHAAGDGTTFPVKQGGIASQQADAVAQVIARRAGASIDPQPFPGVLRGQLLTGGEARFLRNDLSLRARPHSEAAAAPSWWPAAKIAGLHLAPYLAAREATVVPAISAPPEKVESVVYVPADFENNPWGE